MRCKDTEVETKASMDIAVWGLGHVGQITAAYLSQCTSHNIFGVDANPSLVHLLLRDHKSASKNELFKREFRKSARISLLLEGDIGSLPQVPLHFICVDTPTCKEGAQDLKSIKSVCRNVCSVSSLSKGELIVVRSTVLPGSIESTIIPELEEISGKREGTDFFVLMIPCFAREVDYVVSVRKDNWVNLLSNSTKSA